MFLRSTGHGGCQILRPGRFNRSEGDAREDFRAVAKTAGLKLRLSSPRY
jgi:hypothetical protein